MTLTSLGKLDKPERNTLVFQLLDRTYSAENKDCESIFPPRQTKP